MKKGLWLVLALVIIFVGSLSLPVLAGEEKDKAYKKGDKIALETGDEAVVIGYDTHGNPIWQATIGDPVYVRGTDIPYDIQWYLDSKGDYIAGNNDFAVEVKEQKVTITYQDKKLDWNPDVSLTTGGGKVKLKEKLTIPIVLPLDPINFNYSNNTLMWDYGNGVKRYLRLIEGMLIERYEIDEPLNADIEFKSNTFKDAGFIWTRQPEAYDALGRVVDINILEGSIKLKKDKSLKTADGLFDIEYPITIDPDTTVYTSSSDGSMLGYWWGYNYASTRTNATAASVNSAGTEIRIGQVFIDLATDIYQLERGALFFETEAIPDGATITAANISVYGALDGSDTNFDITAQSGAPTYPHDPLELGDYNLTNYTSSGGTLTTVGFNVAGYNHITLDATGRGWINDDADTKIALRSSRDIGGNAPTGYEYVDIYAYEKGSGYRPYLTVTYSVAAPEILINDASNVAKTSARLNATVLDDGYEECQVRWGYGESSEVVVADYDTVTAWSDAEWTTGEHPYEDVTGLTADKTHYFRVEIKNTHSTVASDEETFDTVASLSAPTNLRAFPSQTRINISWVRGDGATQTMVRYKPDNYPTTTTDGILVYEGVLSVYQLEDLITGQTYFISAWGESSGNYSVSYATVATTTSAFAIEEGEGMDTPVVFEAWFLDTDYTTLSNTEPIYSAINGVADSFGTPRNTVWLGLIMFLIVGASIGIMIKFGFEAGFIIGVLLAGLGTGMHLVPLWMVFAMILFGIAYWLLNARGVSSE